MRHAAADPTAVGERLRSDRLVAEGTRHRLRAEYARAEPLLREAVARAESRATSDPQALARALNALGLLCKDVARYDEGRALYARALLVLEGCPDASPHDVAALHHNLAGIAHARGACHEAEPVARRGLAIRLAAPVADPVAAAEDRIALAAILDGLGRYDEAEALCEDAIAALRSSGPGCSAELAVALNNAGARHAERGRLADAIVLLEEALALKRACLPPGHPDVALTLHNLGAAWERRGDLARAIALFEEAESTFERALGPAHPRTRRCRDARARCLTRCSTLRRERNVDREQPPRLVRIDLTSDQRQQVRTTTGHDGEVIELTVTELEERVVPKLASNHNETMLGAG